jgi:hypothetical protein
MNIDFEALAEAARTLNFECQLTHGWDDNQPFHARITCPNASITHDGCDYEWGPVVIEVSRNDISVYVERYRSDRHYGQTHPHASPSSGSMCLGEAWVDTIHAHYKKQEWALMLLAAYNSACSYYPGGAYDGQRLGPQEMFCHACEDYYFDHDMAYCPRCDHDVCYGCSCCDGERCHDCTRRCYSCDERVPTNDIMPCNRCTFRSVCDECLPQYACSECGHVYCPHCCPTTKGLCLDHVDHRPTCANCAHDCHTCGLWTKDEHAVSCELCDREACTTCINDCEECGRDTCDRCASSCDCPTPSLLCKLCAGTCRVCDKALCDDCTETCPACEKGTCGACVDHDRCMICGQLALIAQTEPVHEPPF